MNSEAKRYTGGCLCGALRYEAVGEPLGSGHCYCVDCRRASGSGFVPFMGFRSDSVRFAGEARQFHSKAANGGEAVRNRCAICMSLVFGGEIGKTELVYSVRGLAGRSVVLPSDLRHLRGRPPALGHHPARLQGFRPHAALGSERTPAVPCRPLEVSPCRYCSGASRDGYRVKVERNPSASTLWPP